MQCRVKVNTSDDKRNVVKSINYYTLDMVYYKPFIVVNKIKQLITIFTSFPLSLKRFFLSLITVNG